MGRWIGVLWGVALFALPHTVQADAGRVLTDLILVDPAARELREGSLWIVDGRIAAVGNADGVDLPEGAQVAEKWSAHGRWLLPGLRDASVWGQVQVSPGHRDRLSAADTGRLLLASGVTRYTDHDVTSEVLERRNSGGPPDAARVLSGGPVLVAANGVGSDLPGARVLENEAAARTLVAELAGRSDVDRPDRIVVIVDRGQRRRGLALPILKAVIEEAGDLPVAVVVGSWREVWESLDAGADWLVQIPAGPVPPPVLEIVEKQKPLWTPAIAVGRDFTALMAQSALRESVALARSLPAVMAADYGQVRVPRGRLEEARLQGDDRLAALRQLDALGVRWLAGSRSGGLGTAHGWSLVRELGWWVEAGLDPWDVLVAATIEEPGVAVAPAGFAIGAPADFVLLDASPIEDLQSLETPALVFRAGRSFVPAALAGEVEHGVTEEIPPDPLPGGRQWSLILIVAAGFAVLLILRAWIRRAAAALED